MNVLLHEGHEHTEAATAAVGTETMALAAVGVLLIAAAIGYAVFRFGE
ncbi:hypothetical protein [Haloparvum sedimenti]|nr:hypothetical protein [Haloparvum sedimenti]